MKAGLFAVTALAVTTSAQSNSSTSLMTVYSYYNDCVTSASGLETVTNTATEKYCPECEDKGGPATASPDYNGPMTTYTTTFEQTCSTGLEEKTYTVTDPCPTPGLAREANHVPQGFTVTTVPCHACADKASATLTTPTSEQPTAANGAPAPAPGAPTPGSEAPAAPPAPAAAKNVAPPGSPGSPEIPESPGSQAPESPESPAPAGSGPAAAGAAPVGSSPEATGAPATNAPGSSPAGESSPESSPGSSSGAPGESPPGAPVTPANSAPYPVSGGSEGRNGSSPSGVAPSAGSSSTVTPFTGAASALNAPSFYFASGLIGIMTSLHVL